MNKPIHTCTDAEIRRRCVHPKNRERQDAVRLALHLGDLIHTRRRIYKVVSINGHYAEAVLVYPKPRYRYSHDIGQEFRHFYHLELRRDCSDTHWLTEGKHHIATPPVKDFISYPYWLCLFKLTWMDLVKWSAKETARAYDNADLKATYYDEGCTPQDAVDEEISAGQ
jgi:hypothetical protein